MTQIVTITPDGSIEGLQRKPGQGIDLRQFGKAQIVRASEIVFEEDLQKWRVKILAGPYSGSYLGYLLIAKSQTDAQWRYDAVGPAGTFLYDDYDTAVGDEVAFLDAVRKSGTNK